jgi:hypothetical protein
MTASFTFREEVLLKYDQDVYEAFCDFFDYLPLSCVVNGKFIAVHAGISPDLQTLNDINKINRFTGIVYKKFQRMGFFVICYGQILLKLMMGKWRKLLNLIIIGIALIFLELKQFQIFFLIIIC